MVRIVGECSSVKCEVEVFSCAANDETLTVV